MRKHTVEIDETELEILQEESEMYYWLCRAGVDKSEYWDEALRLKKEDLFNVQ